MRNSPNTGGSQTVRDSQGLPKTAEIEFEDRARHRPRFPSKNDFNMLAGGNANEIGFRTHSHSILGVDGIYFHMRG